MIDVKPSQRIYWLGVIRSCVALYLVMLIGPWPEASAQIARQDAIRSRPGAEGILDDEGRPYAFKVHMYRTSTAGLGPYVGTMTVSNTVIKIAGHDELALLLKANLVGLRPGRHAFHIHENPYCGPKEKNGEMIPGLAAGAHLFAEHQEGSDIVTYKSHLGNLPNLVIDEDGSSTEQIIAPRLSLADLRNRSLMIHASPDDNSAREACGAIR